MKEKKNKKMKNEKIDGGKERDMEEYPAFTKLDRMLRERYEQSKFFEGCIGFLEKRLSDYLIRNDGIFEWIRNVEWEKEMVGSTDDVNSISALWNKYKSEHISFPYLHLLRLNEIVGAVDVYGNLVKNTYRVSVSLNVSYK